MRGSLGDFNNNNGQSIADPEIVFEIEDEIIEVKACSIPNDLTSWSPKPYFDKLY